MADAKQDEDVHVRFDVSGDVLDQTNDIDKLIDDVLENVRIALKTTIAHRSAKKEG